jgi:hypothetical protein
VKTEYIIFSVVFLLALMVIDGIIMMCRLAKDEREVQQEALAERNATWSMVTIIGMGIFFQVIVGIINQRIVLDPFLIAALYPVNKSHLSA